MARKKSPKSKVPSPKSDLVIQFVGKRQKLDKKTGKIKIALAEAPTRIINGAKTILLPSSTEQAKGFTHEDASFLVSVYPKLYKRKLSKGNK